MYLIKLIKSNQVIIIMLYVYMYVVYFVMYDSVLILLLSYGHHDWFNKVFLFLFLAIFKIRFSLSYTFFIRGLWFPCDKFVDCCRAGACAIGDALWRQFDRQQGFLPGSASAILGWP